jgi:hypothetical protein
MMNIECRISNIEYRMTNAKGSAVQGSGVQRSFWIFGALVTESLQKITPKVYWHGISTEIESIGKGIFWYILGKIFHNLVLIFNSLSDPDKKHQQLLSEKWQ